MSDTELTELNLFTYPSSVDNDRTYACNYALTDTSVTDSINNASPGWFSAGPFCELSFSSMTLREPMSKKDSLESLILH